MAKSPASRSSGRDVSLSASAALTEAVQVGGYRTPARPQLGLATADEASGWILAENRPLRKH